MSWYSTIAGGRIDIDLSTSTSTSTKHKLMRAGRM